MAPNVILYVRDLERSRSSLFCKQSTSYPMSVHVKFHGGPIASFSVLVEQSLTEIDLKVAGGKNKKKHFDGCQHFLTQITPRMGNLT